MEGISTQTEIKTGTLTQAWHAMVGYWPAGLTGKDSRRSMLLKKGETVYSVPREKPCPEIERNGYAYVRVNPAVEEVLEIPKAIIEWQEESKTAPS